MQNELFHISQHFQQLLITGAYTRSLSEHSPGSISLEQVHTLYSLSNWDSDIARDVMTYKPKRSVDYCHTTTTDEPFCYVTY